MSEPLRVGIIGTGGVARRIHLPGFRLCPGVEIAAVCDKNEQAARDFGVDTIDSEYEQLLAREEIDAVVVSTPNHLHPQITLAAIQAGKHVLCEKPLALNAGDAEKMLRAAEAAGKVHMTAFTYHFIPAVQFLKHLVDRGELGPIRSVRAAYLMSMATHVLGWRSSKRLAGSGVLADIGSHLVHLVQFLAADIQSLAASQRKFHSDPDSDVEDWFGFLAELEGGACGAFELSRACPGRGADITENMFIELYGEKGAAAMSLQDPCGLQLLSGKDAQDPARLLERVEVPQRFLKLPGSPRNAEDGDPRWNYRYDQAFRFIESIRTNQPAQPTFEEGLRCQRVLDAALASAENKAWASVDAVSHS